jgi:predicted nucleic acid-binding protein
MRASWRLSRLNHERLYVSSVTFADIRFGIELVADAKRRAGPDDVARAAGPTDVSTARPRSQRRCDVYVARAGRAWSEGGPHLSQPDLIIAASALRHGLTVVTRNVDDYAPTNLPLLDPRAHEVAGRKP